MSLFLRNVGYYWRTHLGVVLGTALAVMVLTGSLLVGDSVKATLRGQALLRVGQVESVLFGGDRFFREREAVSSALLLRGSVSTPDGNARVNQAQVLGVDARFWRLSPSSTVPVFPKEPSAMVNERMALQLGVKVGDTAIVRVEKPGLFSRDALLSGDADQVVALRVRIAGIVGAEQFGRFSLHASQVPPWTIFLPLDLLQERLAMKGRANLLLAPRGVDLKKLVGDDWQLADSDLTEQSLGNGTQLRTGRVFLERPIIAAAPKGVGVLTYLVNEIRAGEKSTPYSMVSAVDTAASGFLPADLGEDQIVVNEWLAEDLGLKVGALVSIKYFVMGDRRELSERTCELKVAGILPMAGLDGSWMPDFPGLADKANCREWKPGFDMDVGRFRDKDQEYWEKYRGTPKAFVSLALGQKLWANRFGELTAIRYPNLEKLEIRVDPESLGLQVSAFRGEALAAAQAPVDFAQLFVGFSFFLIGAAVVLTGMLFVFSMEQRRAEMGLLLALGWRPFQVRRLLLAEGAVLAVVGSLIGVGAAVIYTRLVLLALVTVWRGAVGSVTFEFAPSAASIAIGLVSGLVIAIFAMWMAGRGQLKRQARELLTGDSGDALGVQPGLSKPLVLAATAFAAACGLIGSGTSPELFFGAGGLLLVAGIASAWAALRRLSRSTLKTLSQLGSRNASRRRGRSLATVAVLASGVFMVIAVDSFRKRPEVQGADRQSGTGGFALVGESAMPIYEDLNTPKGREALALDPDILKQTLVVPMRVREGDEASCLNLNQALRPRLLGFQPAELANRKAFRLAKGDWLNLGRSSPDGSIAGAVDEATMLWALKKKPGDTLEYLDDQGRAFLVRLEVVLKGSLLQGNVLIAEQDFLQKFPSQGGYRFFLIDTASQESVSTHLSRALQDRGMELTPASRRLAEFQQVENTYLSIFQVLGGLALLLGSLGLAIVVARNVLERRSEFGLLEAVGFQPRMLRKLVFAEHRWLIVAGLLIGAGSALLAVWPALAERSFPLRSFCLLFLALGAGCCLWTWLATRLALRGNRIAALRRE